MAQRPIFVGRILPSYSEYISQIVNVMQVHGSHQVTKPSRGPRLKQPQVENIAGNSAISAVREMVIDWLWQMTRKPVASSAIGSHSIELP